MLKSLTRVTSLTLPLHERRERRKKSTLDCYSSLSMAAPIMDPHNDLTDFLPPSCNHPHNLPPPNNTCSIPHGRPSCVGLSKRHRRTCHRSCCHPGDCIEQKIQRVKRSEKWTGPGCVVIAWIVLAAVLGTYPVSASSSSQHRAEVRGSHCSYTLVVNEMDASKCPAMQADVQSDRRNTRQTWTRRARYLPPRDSALEESQEGGGGGREVQVLKGQVRDLEGRLLDEMVKSRELNSTLTRQAAALTVAEGQLKGHTANFTALYRAMMFVQRALARQRRLNKSVNKKLSNVLLDVMEVNNVLTRGPVASPQQGSKANAGAAAKDFQVLSVAKVRSCPGVTDKSNNYHDCAAVFEGGHKRSGVYYVKPAAAPCPVPVWCDMDTPPGGWLLLQRRQDGSVSFNQKWAQYKDGFGNVAGEHWLGNDNMFLLSNQAHYQLRVDLWDFSGNRVHATYTTFRVAGERDKYELTVSGYTGSAQDSLYRHNRMAFSTPDRDNDGRREAHCAMEWEAGWWFNNCWFALLNGAYHNRSDVAYRGIAWNHWKREQLRKSEMKIRPLQTPPSD